MRLLVVRGGFAEMFIPYPISPYFHCIRGLDRSRTTDVERYIIEQIMILDGSGTAVTGDIVSV